jgi:DNA polymerase-3 subunit delta'
MWTTIGHDNVAASLQRAFSEGRLAHAYLLAGSRHLGKMTMALDLARLVNCQGEAPPCGECDQCTRITHGLHADVQVVAIEAMEADKARRRVTIGIEQVRELLRAVSLKPYEGRYRVCIFDGAERLTEDAANALLKTLEEPPEQVILVLLTTNVESLLATIVSRCQRLDLRPLDLSLVAGELKSRFGADDERAEEIARLSSGRIGWAFLAMSQPELLETRSATLEAIETAVHDGLEGRFSYANGLASQAAADRDLARQTLELWTEWWRDVMVVKVGAPELVANLSRIDGFRAASDALSQAQVVGAIGAVQEARVNLERNVNARLALEGLMLALPRL